MKLSTIRNDICYFTFGFFNTLSNYLIRENSNDQKYLFIISPPFSGSSIIIKSFLNEPSCSVMNRWSRSTYEGQSLPGLKYFKIEPPYLQDLEFNEKRYHKWSKFYWNLSKKYLVDKSPPNIIYAKNLEKLFCNSYFIINVRSPYGFIESHIRRLNWSIKKATKFYVKCLKYQRANIEDLSNNILIRYEDFVADSQAVEKKIKLFTSLSNFEFIRYTKNHNRLNTKMGLEDFNKRSIDSLGKEKINKINFLLENDLSLINNFGYELH